MNNREKLEMKLQAEGLAMGCYQKEINELSEAAIHLVLDEVKHGSADVVVTHRNEPHVVEIYHVDREVDFELISAKDYEAQYGRAVNS